VVRERLQVLKTISALLDEVSQLSASIDHIDHDLGRSIPTLMDVTNSDAKVFGSGGRLITDQQVQLVVESLLSVVNKNGSVQDFKLINALVEDAINSAVEDWVNSNLESLVSDVVSSEVDRIQSYGGGRR
jgi:cell pole-organizing protein PopZ